MAANKSKLAGVAVSTAMALTALTLPMAAQAELSGNIGIHSKYLLRGIFEENTGAAVQGGLDYTQDGFYVGWWFSSLGYSYEAPSDLKTDEKGFENDLYLGYAGEVQGLGYNVGLIQYVYVNVDDSNLLEFTGKLTYAGFYVGLQALLNDGWWGNSGDIYWKAGYSAKLPMDFGLALDYGYYTYDDNDNGELGSSTLTNSGFRHLNFTLSHPIADTGASVYAQYTVAGEDRTGAEYDDSMVAGITYSHAF